MCLAFLGWNVHPEYAAVILFNRDEFLSRYVTLVPCYVEPVFSMKPFATLHLRFEVTQACTQALRRTGLVA